LVAPLAVNPGRAEAVALAAIPDQVQAEFQSAATPDRGDPAMVADLGLDGLETAVTPGLDGLETAVTPGLDGLETAVTPGLGDQVMVVNLDRVGLEDAATLGRDAAGPESAARSPVATRLEVQSRREDVANLGQDAREVLATHDRDARRWEGLVTRDRDVLR
jgi:hypothetical protein